MAEFQGNTNITYKLKERKKDKPSKDYSETEKYGTSQPKEMHYYKENFSQPKHMGSTSQRKPDIYGSAINPRFDPNAKVNLSGVRKVVSEIPEERRKLLQKGNDPEAILGMDEMNSLDYMLKDKPYGTSLPTPKSTPKSSEEDSPIKRLKKKLQMFGQIKED